MKVAGYFKKDRISLNLRAGTKEEAINELALLVKNTEDVTDYDLFLRDVFEREKVNTTGIGNEIAIPHARTDSVKEFVIIFGRSQEGVEFSAIDEKPVKLIFLMATPKENNLDNYLRILARLTRILQRDSFKSTLLTAQSPEEIIDAFNSLER